MVVAKELVVMATTLLSFVMVTAEMSVAFVVASVIAPRLRCHSNACMATVVWETVLTERE